MNTFLKLFILSFGFFSISACAMERETGSQKNPGVLVLIKAQLLNPEGTYTQETLSSIPLAPEQDLMMLFDQRLLRLYDLINIKSDLPAISLQLIKDLSLPSGTYPCSWQPYAIYVGYLLVKKRKLNFLIRLAQNGKQDFIKAEANLFLGRIYNKEFEERPKNIIPGKAHAYVCKAYELALQSKNEDVKNDALQWFLHNK